MEWYQKGGSQLARDAAAQPQNTWLQERIAQAPPIDTPWQQFLWDCFWDLSTERPMGMSCVGPIPLTMIRLHAEHYGLDHREAYHFEKVMRAMDNTYLSIESEKLAQQQKKNASRR